MHGSIPRLDVAAPCSSFRVSEFLARLESCVVLALSRTSPRCRSRTMRSCLVAKHVQTGFLRSIGRMLGDCVTRDCYRTRLVRHACALEGLPSHLPWPSLQGLLPVLWPSSETSLCAEQLSAPLGSELAQHSRLEAPGGFTLFAATFAAEFPAEAVAVAEAATVTAGNCSNSQKYSIGYAPKPKLQAEVMVWILAAISPSQQLSFRLTVAWLCVKLLDPISALLLCLSPLSPLR